MRYNGEGSISIFISKVLAFRDQLAHTPQALTDNEITTHLITHLPKSWRSIRDLISYQPADNKTLDYVINALIKYEAENLNDEDEKLATNAFSITMSNRSATGLRDKQNNNRG